MSTQSIPAFSGELLRPGDAAYDRARRVWNGAIDRRPALIARCRSTQDVVSAVDLARRSDLAVSVRGSGHHFAGLAVWDDALMVDLSPMKGISLDAERRTAVVQPGVTWGELDAAAQEHGLATTGADAPGVGVAGSTLAGGIGWLHRVAGLSCDNLLSAEVVTAAGQVRRAAPDEHDDIEALVAGAEKTPSPVTSLILQQLGGAMSRVPEAGTAFAWRGAAHHLGVVGLWRPGDPPEPTIEWVRSMWERALPASAGGGYSANLMDRESERVRASYGVHHARLAAIKARYDPGNFFRINPNIAPDPEEAFT